MRRFLTPALLLLLLIAAGFGLAQLNEVRKLQLNVTSLDTERSALRKRIWELEKLNRELAGRMDRGTNPSGNTAGTDAGAAGEPARADAANPWRGGGGGNRFAALMNSPEGQRLMSLQQKGALDSRYAALFKKLGLSPEALEQFKNLLVEKQTAVMDVLAAARAQGLDFRTNRDEIQQLVQTTQAEVNTTLRATLGETAFTQYQNYEATLPQRGVVDQLNQRLSYTTTPLTDGQSEQLVQILAANSPAPANRGSAGGNLLQSFGGPPRALQSALLGGNAAPITDNAIAQAQGVLAAPQVAALQSLQQEQQAAAQLAQQVRSGFGGQSRGSTAPTQGATPQAKPAAPGGG